MKFPKYWARGKVSLADHKGKGQTFIAWGWSDSSHADAEQKGKERAARFGESILKGDPPDHYRYGNHPMREEVIREFRESDGEMHSAITINSYGCHVLNSTKIMFVDIDFPVETASMKFLGHLKNLFGKKQSIEPRESHETAFVGNLEAVLASRENCGVRVYRTKAGLRYLFSNLILEPSSEEAAQLMKSLDADPLYLKLCKAQECFRARLTPKPWRCQINTPRVSYPWLNKSHKEAYEKWSEKYERACEKYATCQFVSDNGVGVAHEVVELINIHDQFTKARSGLPLA